MAKTEKESPLHDNPRSKRMASRADWKEEYIGDEVATDLGHRIGLSDNPTGDEVFEKLDKKYGKELEAADKMKESLGGPDRRKRRK